MAKNHPDGLVLVLDFHRRRFRRRAAGSGDVVVVDVSRYRKASFRWCYGGRFWFVVFSWFVDIVCVWVVVSMNDGKSERWEMKRTDYGGDL